MVLVAKDSMLLLIAIAVLAAAGATPSADVAEVSEHCLLDREGEQWVVANDDVDEEALLQVNRHHVSQPVAPVFEAFANYMMSGRMLDRVPNASAKVGQVHELVVQEGGNGTIAASPMSIARVGVALGDGMYSDPLYLPTGFLLLLFVLFTAMYLSGQTNATEMAEIWHLAFPISLSNMCEYLPNFAAVWVLGRIITARKEQAATALGRAVADACFIVAWGLTSALHTLAPQAEGAGKRKKQALYLQQALVVVSVAAVLLAGVMYWSGSLLMLMGQERSVVAVAFPYVLLCIPRLFFESYTTVLQRVGQAMGMARHLAWLMLFGVGAGLVFLYLFVVVADLSYIGIACSVSSVNLFNLITHVTYLSLAAQPKVRGAPTPRASSQGAQAETSPVDPHLQVNLFKPYSPCRDVVKWSGMARYLELAVPGTMHICFEWWAFVGVTIYTGLLKDPELNLAACVVVMTVKDILYMAWQGVAGAASIAVGKAVGARSKEDVQEAVRASIAVALCLSVLVALPLWLAGAKVAAVMTSNVEVQSKVTSAFRVLAVFIVPDCLNVTLAGMLRGMGLQTRAAVHQFLGFWLIGLPLTALVALKYGSNPYGLELIWGSFVIAVAVSAPLNKACIWMVDWDEVFGAARSRLATPVQSEDGWWKGT